MYMLREEDKNQLVEHLSELKACNDEGCNFSGGNHCRECWEDYFCAKEIDITFYEYQKLAMRTAKLNEHTSKDNLLNGALGLAGESGEVIDLIKKHSFQDHPLKKEKIAEELGDVLWYVALLAEALNLSIEEIAKGNIEKLEKRYPKNVFDKDDSINRR